MNRIQLTLGALLIGAMSLSGCASTIEVADENNTASAPHIQGTTTNMSAQPAQSATEATTGKEVNTGTFSNAKSASPN